MLTDTEYYSYIFKCLRPWAKKSLKCWDFWIVSGKISHCPHTAIIQMKNLRKSAWAILSCVMSSHMWKQMQASVSEVWGDTGNDAIVFYIDSMTPFSEPLWAWNRYKGQKFLCTAMTWQSFQVTTITDFNLDLVFQLYSANLIFSTFQFSTLLKNSTRFTKYALFFKIKIYKIS